MKNIKYTEESTLQRWELDNNAYRKVISGIYIAVFKYGSLSEIRKLIIFV